MNQQDSGHIYGSMCLASQIMVASLSPAHQSSRLLSKGVKRAPLGQGILNPSGSELKRDHGVTKRKGDRESLEEERSHRSNAG